MFNANRTHFRVKKRDSRVLMDTQNMLEKCVGDCIELCTGTVSEIQGNLTTKNEVGIDVAIVDPTTLSWRYTATFIVHTREEGIFSDTGLDSFSSDMFGENVGITRVEAHANEVIFIDVREHVRSDKNRRHALFCERNRSPQMSFGDGDCHEVCCTPPIGIVQGVLQALW